MFIAEIGINHNGSLANAKRLIDVACEAGADIVKFQKRNIEKAVPEKEQGKIKDTPWGRMPYVEYKRRVEFEKEAYDEIDIYCRNKGIRWTASVWDADSVDFIVQYDVPFIKIASACITDKELLNRINKTELPVVLSTGMSTLEEIKIAVQQLTTKDITLLHCNSSYPAKDEELDLNVITTLKEIFPQYKIGYSGHELGIGACIVAKTLGAEVIERHITLDKNMWGSDQVASLEFEELKELITMLNKVPTWVGSKEIKVYPSEEKVKHKLRRIL